ncbi:caspase-3-like [Hydra vulgaris]|uniref:caspase-3-like n=1 Tax=Hydra vulgaris TaxID=6087 RepID=UPI0001925C7B
MDNLKNLEKPKNDSGSFDDVDSRGFEKQKESMMLESVSSTSQDGACLSTNPSKPKNFVGKQESPRTDEEGLQFKSRFYPHNKPKEDIAKDNYNFNSDCYYEIKNFPRGILTIIHVNKFLKSSGMRKHFLNGSNADPDNLSEADADNLRDLFLDLGFDVTRLDNPKYTDVMSNLEKIANKDCSKMTCCVVAVLTHINEEDIFCTDKPLKISDIRNVFCTEALLEIPKIFLIQSYRGKQCMKPKDMIDGSTSVKKGPDLPAKSDFLFAYSTLSGYGSCQNEKAEPSFIKAVIGAFRKYSYKMDVVRLLTCVIDEINTNNSNSGNQTKKELVSFNSSLRKELFLPLV